MVHSEAATEAGSAALEKLDRALSKRPIRDGDDFSEATRHLCRMRDATIEQRRSGSGSDERLGQVNALISISMAGQFPLGSPPWELIEQGRHTLARLLAAT